MNLHFQAHSADARRVRARGSVLVIVLWVSLGLVSITLYFAHTMTMSLRATDNRVAGLVAEQAVESGSRYAGVVLSNSFSTTQVGLVPDPTTYRCTEMPVGDAKFWLIGRVNQQTTTTPDAPYFGLIDESSKLNLNAPFVTAEVLQFLPRMTPELAAAIIDWRDSDSDISDVGAESEVYQRMRPAYSCKNAPFETVDELRMVYGFNTEILFGEDANLNGILDQNENDGTVSLPYDNRDSRLDAGVFEYLTVYSVEPNKRADGTARVNIAQTTELQTYLQDKFGQQRANEIVGKVGTPGNRTTNLLQFYVASGMTAEEFGQIEPDILSTNQMLTGLVNAATAPLEVLTCIPGIGKDFAATIVNYRSSNPSRMTSIAWLTEVLEPTNAATAGNYVTSRSYQYTADVAAVGQHGRGYRRTRFVLDMTTGTPVIVRRQDLTHLGWALGVGTRRTLLAQNSK
jgi:type II secretory pathway component PulK